MTRAEPDTESDIELSSALHKTKTHKRIPNSPTEEVLVLEPKKNSTKVMVLQALTDLRNRKGVSLQAIKKYMEEKYQVDTRKIAYYIKKYIKSAVEAGIIIQTKGVGASGSFKLAADKKEEKNKKVKPVKKKTAKVDEEKEKKPSKATKVREEVKIVPEEKEKKNESKEPKKQKKTKTKKVAAKSDQKTPTKKKPAMVKRKSIGSIIKKPKMKPSKKKIEN